MVSNFLNSPAEKAASMLRITDNDIRDMSYGKITGRAFVYKDDEDDGNVSETGLLGEKTLGFNPWTAPVKDVLSSTRMYHIELPVPVVNIQYVRGRKPVLAKKLGIPRKALERVIYCITPVAARDITLEDGTHYNKNDIIEETSRDYASESVLYGGAAVKALMEAKGVDVPGAVLSTVPVLPPAFFLEIHYPNFIEENKKGIPDDKKTRGVRLSLLGETYNHVAGYCERVKHILSFTGAPVVIIRNELRVLQERVDTLIINGAAGMVTVNYWGLPYDCLQDSYTSITSLSRRKKFTLKESDIPQIDVNALKKAITEYTEFYDDGVVGDNIEKKMEILSGYKNNILGILRPAAEKVADLWFGDSGVSRDIIVDNALYNYSSPMSYISAGFDRAILSFIDVNNQENKLTKPNIGGLMRTMGMRVSKYLEYGIMYDNDLVDDNDCENDGKGAA